MTEGPIGVLVVDDEEPIRTALKKYLTQQGYEVSVAASGEEALSVLQRQKVACMLLDVRMPGLSGVELVPQVMELEPNIALLMLTAVNDATSAALCMQRGAMDYLTKPIELTDLANAIQRALRLRATNLEQQKLNLWLKEEVAIRTAEVRSERAKLERLSVATLETLVNALEAKDPFLRGHSARVADLAAQVAAQMELSDEDVEIVRIGGRLHDIGKIGIREGILAKEGPLTTDEYDQVKEHVIIGSQILAPLVHLRPIIDYVRSHHERWDGKGYPDGLKGNTIPLGARILAACEIFDALATSRPYQEKMTPDLAVDRMRELVGTSLDRNVYEALEAVIKRRHALVYLDHDRD